LADYFSNTNETEFVARQILYDKAFSIDECNQIIEFAGKLPPIDAEVGSGYTDHNHRKTIARYIALSKESAWIAQRIMTIAEQANERFFNYKLYSLNELQMLEYTEGGHYNWHMDNDGTKPFAARKLSITVFLSDPNAYAGGRLEWMPALKKNIAMGQGYIVIFPSYKLHRVIPVTKGTRHSLVAWVHGG
jgi:PKHD-type hydroxylase